MSATVLGFSSLLLLAGSMALWFRGIKNVAAKAVAVGDIIPSFSAPDEDGTIFNSASLAGSPALIKFFRGHW